MKSLFIIEFLDFLIYIYDINQEKRTIRFCVADKHGKVVDGPTMSSYTVNGETVMTDKGIKFSEAFFEEIIKEMYDLY